MSKEQDQMVSDCVERESRLSDWERGFVESIETQIEQGRTLSEKQDSRLNEIWEKVTADG